MLFRSRSAAAASLSEVQLRFKEETVVTEILAANTFWPVEEYHQDYYLKNPFRYKFYKTRCGRPARLEALWGNK